MKFLYLILFLILYLSSLLSFHTLYNKLFKAEAYRKILLTIPLVLIPNIYFILSVFLLGNLFNSGISILLISASFMGVIITVLLWKILGNSEIPIKEIINITDEYYRNKNIRPFFIPHIVIIIVLVVYPLYIGTFYLLRDNLNVYWIIANNSIFFFILFFAEYPRMLKLLTSHFINEYARTKVLIEQFTLIIPLTLYISLLFWGFDSDISDKLYKEYSIPILLFVFLLTSLAIPYLIGVNRAEYFRSNYYRSIQIISFETQSFLSINRYLSISPNYKVIKRDINNLIILLSLNNNDNIKKNVKENDIRYIYKHYLDILRSKIEYYANNLSRGGQHGYAIIKSIEYDQKSLNVIVESIDKYKSIPKVMSIVILSTILSGMLSIIGELLIRLISKII
jgi:hypothetical protein